MISSAFKTKVRVVVTTGQRHLVASLSFVLVRKGVIVKIGLLFFHERVINVRGYWKKLSCLQGCPVFLDFQHATKPSRVRHSAKSIVTDCS